MFTGKLLKAWLKWGLRVMGTDTWNEIFLFVAKLVQLKIIKHFLLRKPVSNFLGGMINKIFYYIAMKPLTIPWGHTVMPRMAVQESQGILYTLYINEVLKLWNAYLVLYFFKHLLVLIFWILRQLILYKPFNACFYFMSDPSA